jgi:glucan 1,3-beta-glucosidase
MTLTIFIDCGNTLQNGGAPAPDGNALCDMTCDGNTAETCGGPNRLDLYTYTSGSPTSTSTAASGPTGSGNPLAGWTFKGCYTDSTAARTLPNMEPVSGGMTNEGCQNACLAAGYSIAGTEYAGECCKYMSLTLL